MIVARSFNNAWMAVQLNGRRAGAISKMFVDDRESFVFEPSGSGLAYFRAADLREVADKLDELNGVAND